MSSGQSIPIDTERWIVVWLDGSGFVGAAAIRSFASVERSTDPSVRALWRRMFWLRHEMGGGFPLIVSKFNALITNSLYFKLQYEMELICCQAKFS
jgi:hypothetical protein